MDLRRSHFLVAGITIALVLSSCSNHGKTTPAPSTTAATVDCTGYTSTMVVPSGLTVGTAPSFAKATFAKLIAVDKGDGEMEITIQAPDGGFPIGLIDSYSGYTLRFIACRENISTITSGGIDSRSACSSLGSINLVGKEGVTSADFTDGVYKAGGLTIHATTSPTFDSSKNLLRPNFIMLTAGLIDTNLMGEFMIAFGTSPYYNGCYSNKQ